uniref:Membrane integral NOTCH2 associated receptor 2 n=1 Tax=Myotis myotis TaxID=51298 RepID=A0A7J7XJ84_MYOMY|nr:membrane integral NOTCH2 associated receptor 2 [Myotis myotis]
MDLSALPNNNHPDKFLQLDVKLLMRNSALLQASLVRFPGGNYPAAQHWQNLVYSQVRPGSPGSPRTGTGAPFSLSASSAFVQKEGWREPRARSLPHSCHREKVFLP